MAGRRTAATVAALLAAAAAVLAGPVDAGAADQPKASAMVLVLDASGSMNESDGHGSTKIAAAKAALRTIIGQLPSDLQVGLRVYGHRVPSKPDHAKACQDTQLIAPVAPLDRAALTAAVDGFAAKGETPIGTSLKAAAADLPAGAAGSVVLVSDGQDSCAPPEPCDVARQLKSSGVQLTVDTVGLQVDAKAKTQLTCISQATGGTYTDVKDTARLAESLGAVATRARRVATVGGDKVEGKPTQEEAPKIVAGKYSTDVVSKETLYYAVDLAAGQKVKVRVTVDAQKFASYTEVGCCAVARLLDIDGHQYAFDNDVPQYGKLTKMALEVTEPLEKPATLYLELQNQGGTTKAGAVLPLVLEVEVSGAAASASASPSDGGASAPAGGSAQAAGAPASAPAAPATVETGYSTTAVAATGLVGLVAGAAAGALGAVVLMRRLRGSGPTEPLPSGAGSPGPGLPDGPGAATYPPPQTGQPPYGTPPPYGRPGGPPPFGGPQAPPQAYPPTFRGPGGPQPPYPPASGG